MMDDLINRQDAIDVARNCRVIEVTPAYMLIDKKEMMTELMMLPSAQTTINGYDIRHLELIAAVLQKENLPPERVTEAIADIGGIVAIVRDEFEETLRKAVEQCMT